MGTLEQAKQIENQNNPKANHYECNGVPFRILEIGNENEQIKSVFHYTSMKALNGILAEDDICLWAGRFDCQNDLNEFSEAQKNIIPKIEKQIERKLTEKEKVYPYIISFSQNRDDLNVWRLYHSKVSLEIDLDSVFSQYTPNRKGHFIPIITGPCQYYNNRTITKKYKYIDQELSKCPIYNSESGNKPIQEALSLLKKGTYSYEKEYRISISDHNPESNSGDGHFKDIEVFGRDNGNLLFYKKLYFPKKALKSITVFEPNELQFERYKQNLNFLLKDRGYENVEINKTDHQFMETH